MAVTLSPAAQEEYDRNREMLTACGVLPDPTTLKAYAIAMVEMRDAQAQIDGLGQVVATGNGTVTTNPYVGIRDRALAVVERLGVRLRLPDIEGRATQPAAETKPRIKQVQSALVAAGGVVSDAAFLLGVSRGTIQYMVDKHPSLSDLIATIKESNKDFAESKLMAAMAKGEAWAVCFYLKCHAKDRGYIERPKVEPPAMVGAAGEREVTIYITGGPPEPDETITRRV